MKKSGLILLASAAAFMPSGAAAQTRPGFEVGAELFDYDYNERFEGETVARDDGKFGGITFGYVETIGGGSFLRAKLSVDFGSVDYSSDDGEIEDVSQDIGQLEFHFGHDFRIGERASLTPFVGLGSRVLEDHSGGEETEFGLLGYDREISYAYVPVGLAATFRVGGSASLALSAQYNWVVGGEAKSDFSGIDPEFPDVKVDLQEGHGFEASAMVSLPIGRSAIGFGPFVRSWRIRQSESFVLTDPEGSGESIELFEPATRTTEAGVRLSFAF